MPGRFFDEWQVGDTIAHAVTRTVTETDNVLISTLTHNPQPLHLDHEAAAASRIRPAAGQFALHLRADGRRVSVSDTTLGTLVANLGYDELRLPRPGVRRRHAAQRKRSASRCARVQVAAQCRDRHLGAHELQPARRAGLPAARAPPCSPRSPHDRAAAQLAVRPRRQREEDRQGARQRRRRDHLRPRGQRRPRPQGRRARDPQGASAPRAGGPRWWVRINPLGSEHHKDDLDLLGIGDIDGIVLPKAESGADVIQLAHRTGNIPIHAIVTETAASLFGLLSYRDAKSPLVAMSWGAEDLSAALGASSKYDADGRAGLHLQAGALACASPARSPPGSSRSTACSPISATTKGLATEARAAAARRLHRQARDPPGQVAPINAAFTPSADEIAHARGDRRRVRRRSRRGRAVGRRQDGRPPASDPGAARSSTTQRVKPTTGDRTCRRKANGMGHRRRRPAAAADALRTPRASPRRCRDQHHLRRHLPFRPPHLPQRLGRHPLSGRSRATRSSARSPRSAATSPSTRSATRSRSAAWSTAAWNATSAWKAGKCSAARAASRPTTAPTITTATISKGGYTDHIVVRDHFVCKVPEGMDAGPRRAFAVRRDHDLLAAAPI